MEGTVAGDTGELLTGRFWFVTMCNRRNVDYAGRPLHRCNVMENAPHILLVDDDPEIRRGLTTFLREQGLRVDTAASGEDVDKTLSQGRFDLIVLDVMLPGESGLSICKRVSAEADIPIILLTAIAGEADRIVGLEIGADDYVCKPFSPRELLARIRVVLRRPAKRMDGAQTVRSTRFGFANWVLDLRARSLKSPTGGHVDLTTGEFELLQAFVQHPNIVLDRDRLLDLARGRTSYTVDRTIDVQVMRLRRKLEEDPQCPQLIKTIRNGGYIFTPEVTHIVDDA